MFKFVYNIIIYMFAIAGAFQYSDLMGGVVSFLFALSLYESLGGLNAR